MLNCFSQGPCSFEPGLCGWKDTSLGAYKWDRNKGTTIVAGTGPSVDHTCGNASCKQSNDFFLLWYEFYREDAKNKCSIHWIDAWVCTLTLCFTVRLSLKGSTASFMGQELIMEILMFKRYLTVVFHFCQLLLDRQSTSTIRTIAFSICTGSNFILVLINILCWNERLLCLCPLWGWFIFWWCNFTKSKHDQNRTRLHCEFLLSHVHCKQQYLDGNTLLEA